MKFIPTRSCLSLFILALYFPLCSFAQLPGSLDPTFGNGGVKAFPDFLSGLESPSDILQQPDGKILVCTDHGIGGSILVMRLLPDGSLDPDFGNNGVSEADNAMRPGAMALDQQGRIVLAGRTGWNGAVIRLMSDGSLDENFGSNGHYYFDQYVDIYSVDIADEGGIAVAGLSSQDMFTTTDFFAAKLTAGGAPDLNFSDDGVFMYDLEVADNFLDMDLLPNGDILANGNTYDYVTPGLGEMVLFRIKSDGTLDEDFATNGYFRQLFDGIHTLSLSMETFDDGHIIVNAAVENPGLYDLYDYVLVKFNADGTLDETFSDDGYSRLDLHLQNLETDNLAHEVKIQADGKMVLAGRTWDPAFNGYRFLTACVLPDGEMDPGFGDDGFVVTEFPGWATIGSMALQTDGKIIVSGSQTDSLENGANGHYVTVARYKAHNDAIGVEEEELSTGLHVYPNPCADHLVIQLDNTESLNVYARIYSSTGALAKSFCLRSSNYVVDVDDLPAGFYYLETDSGSRCSFVRSGN